MYVDEKQDCYIGHIGDGDARPEDVVLHVETPCLLSPSLSRLMAKDVYLKLENLQPTGSFKIRGVGELCLQARKEGYKRVVCSSGGNAGLAAAYSAHKLGLACTVFTANTTSNALVDQLRGLGASVQVVGDQWSEANQAALRYAEQSRSFFVHPFDHPAIWSGHASMARELLHQLPSRPAAIIAAVGGGGLATGLLQGMAAIGWGDVLLVTVETEGADSFQQSILAGERVSLDKITSVARTLGASQVCARLFDSYFTRNIRNIVVSDLQAISACVQFADEHRMLVEASCGAALAALYSRRLPDCVTKKTGPLAVIVCGGCDVSTELIGEWRHASLVPSHTNNVTVRPQSVEAKCVMIQEN